MKRFFYTAFVGYYSPATGAPMACSFPGFVMHEDKQNPKELVVSKILSIFNEGWPPHSISIQKDLTAFFNGLANQPVVTAAKAAEKSEG